MTTIHDKTSRLMPWLINGTLPDDARREIEAHLNACLTCRAALRKEQLLQTLVRNQDDVPLGPGYGVADLLSRIERRQQDRSIRRINPRLALGIGIAVVTFALLLPFMIAEQGDRDTGSFSTLTDGGALSANRIDIVFMNTVDAAGARQIIDEIGGRIVGGPTELGRYTVELVPIGDLELDSLIAQLDNDPKIRFAGRSFTESGPAAEPDR